MSRDADQARAIEAYVQSRYVRGESVPHIDESFAVRLLDAYLMGFRTAPGESCGYVGILWFEVSFRPMEDAVACLERARMWLFRARTRCPQPWQAVEERLIDVDAMLES